MCAGDSAWVSASIESMIASGASSMWMKTRSTGSLRVPDHWKEPAARAVAKSSAVGVPNALCPAAGGVERRSLMNDEMSSSAPRSRPMRSISSRSCFGS